MSKKVMVVSTSLRKGSNSELLAGEFTKGARDAGHQVEMVDLERKDIRFCTGCLVCQNTRRCVIQDDANQIIQQMCSAEVVAFATPIYFYEMSGQMKTLLDRTNPLFPADYAFRDIYLLTAAADSEESAMDGAVKGLDGWIACFEKTKLSGVLKGVGVDSAGAVKNKPVLLQAAYDMGKSI